MWAEESNCEDRFELNGLESDFWGQRVQWTKSRDFDGDSGSDKVVHFPKRVEEERLLEREVETCRHSA